MNARFLLGILREAGVELMPREDRLHVDAPVGALTGTLRKSLLENQEALIEVLERERVRLEAADRRGLIIRWSEHPVWIELHDPLTGEWHEVRASECLPGIAEAANRRHGRRKNENNSRAS